MAALVARAIDRGVTHLAARSVVETHGRCAKERYRSGGSAYSGLERRSVAIKLNASGGLGRPLGADTLAAFEGGCSSPGYGLQTHG
jgi:hypothetical protein